MRALSLDHNNPHHEGYYRAMRVSGISPLTTALHDSR